MSTARDFRTQLTIGKVGESHVARWLRSRCGYNVLPIYEKELSEGKGPTLFPARHRPLIAPDMLVFRTTKGGEQRIRWIEAKTKSAFTWYRKGRRWVTGIDLRHYTEYQKVAAMSPWPLWIMFLQHPGRAKDSPDGCPVGLFGRDITYLMEHEDHRWDEGGMVYWWHGDLELIATLDDVLNASLD